MRGRTSKYSEEMRAETIRLCESDSRSQSEIAKSLGISQTTVNRWVRESQRGVESKNTSLDAATAEKLRRLEEENRRLRLEHDILKKAAAFFAKNQQ